MPEDGHGEKVIYSDEHRRLTELLREVREEAGMTQAQVAAEFGRPMDYVSRMEGGQRRVDMVEWLRFLRICGADHPVWEDHLRPCSADQHQGLHAASARLCSLASEIAPVW